MYRKLNIKTLTWVFVSLLILTVFVKVIDTRRGVNTLQAELFTLDENEVKSLIISPKMLKGETIELKRNKDGWQVSSNGKTYNGDASTIEALLRELNGLKPIRLASQDKDRWASFELTDSLASKVQFMGDKGELASLFIGKFSYSQASQSAMTQQYPYMRPQGTMSSYVRYNNEKEVYAVEGFLGSRVNRDMDAFRDKTLLKVKKNSLNKIVFSYPADSSFTMEKKEGVWMSEGQPLDSASVAKYLSRISSLRASGFADMEQIKPSHKIQLIQDQAAPIEISASIEGDDAFMMSSLNPNSVFKERSSANFKKIFISKNELLE